MCVCEREYVCVVCVRAGRRWGELSGTMRFTVENLNRELRIVSQSSHHLMLSC